MTKTIKGQAWIAGDSLVQDQILVLPNGITSNNTVALIDNIWDDLTSKNGTYKWNGKSYFYWTYKMTDSENDDSEIEVMIECPRPKEELFGEGPYDNLEVEGDYMKYWLNQYKTSWENQVKSMTIQPEEIVLHESEYIDSMGNVTKIPEKKIKNTDLGDITNLLGLF